MQKMCVVHGPEHVGLIDLQFPLKANGASACSSFFGCHYFANRAACSVYTRILVYKCIRAGHKGCVVRKIQFLVSLQEACRQAPMSCLTASSTFSLEVVIRL